MSGQRKLKLLALHGFKQSAPVFKERTNSLRKALKSCVEIEYIDAPHYEKIDPELEKAFGKVYGWFSTQENTSYLGIEKSLDFVVEKLRENSYDGIISFSQGAVLGAVLCAMMQKGELPKNAAGGALFSFAIFVSGFIPRDPKYKAEFASEKMTVPSLHVFGETDNIVPFQESKNLAQCFSKSDVHFHGGGHFVPATAKDKQKYLSFLDQFRTD
eukprot:GCRY01001666.1.p1 GENE.GCRY01001666.1~~GCRY01001666.1.p1  ORF type:complete len:214 (-),score=29.58 GCRY01001666.1:186-827(-)